MHITLRRVHSVKPYSEFARNRNINIIKYLFFSFVFHWIQCYLRRYYYHYNTRMNGKKNEMKNLKSVFINYRARLPPNEREREREKSFRIIIFSRFVHLSVRYPFRLFFQIAWWVFFTINTVFVNNNCPSRYWDLDARLKYVMRRFRGEKKTEYISYVKRNPIIFFHIFFHVIRTCYIKSNVHIRYRRTLLQNDLHNVLRTNKTRVSSSRRQTKLSK